VTYADVLAATLAWGEGAVAQTNGVGRVVAEAHVHDDGVNVTLVQAYNIQSVVRNSTGNYTVTPVTGIDASKCAHSVEYLGSTVDDLGIIFSSNSEGSTLNVLRYDLDGGPENGAFTVAFMGNPVIVPDKYAGLLDVTPNVEIPAGAAYSLGDFLVSTPRIVTLTASVFVSSGTLTLQIPGVSGSTITVTAGASPQVVSVSGVSLPSGTHSVLAQYVGSGYCLVQEVSVI